MIGARSRVEVSRMTIHTFGGCTSIPFGMTFSAVNTNVGTRQWKFGFVMIKRGRFPGGLTMAAFTTGGKVRCFMIRICGRIIICSKTSKTSLRSRPIVYSFVTRRTVIGYGRMCPGNHIILIVIGKGSR